MNYSYYFCKKSGTFKLTFYLLFFVALFDRFLRNFKTSFSFDISNLRMRDSILFTALLSNIFNVLNSPEISCIFSIFSMPILATFSSNDAHIRSI